MAETSITPQANTAAGAGRVFDLRRAYCLTDRQALILRLVCREHLSPRRVAERLRINEVQVHQSLCHSYRVLLNWRSQMREPARDVLQAMRGRRPCNPKTGRMPTAQAITADDWVADIDSLLGGINAAYAN